MLSTGGGYCCITLAYMWGQGHWDGIGMMVVGIGPGFMWCVSAIAAVASAAWRQWGGGSGLCLRVVCPRPCISGFMA